MSGFGVGSAYKEQQLKIRGIFVCFSYLQSLAIALERTTLVKFLLSLFQNYQPSLTADKAPDYSSQAKWMSLVAAPPGQPALLQREEEDNRSSDEGAFEAGQQVSIPRAFCPLSCLLLHVFFLWECINWA